MRRAPDFFDWRSGVLEFVMDRERLEQESQRLWLEGEYEKYLTWTPQQHNVRIMEIQALLEEPQQTPERKLDLLIDQGNLFLASKRYEAAISSYKRAIAIKPDFHEGWYNRGYALSALGRKEEAIDSYDQAIAIKPDELVWCNRGLALYALGHKEAAIASYEKAIEVNPYFHEGWYNRGGTLSTSGRNEEAIASYEKAVEITRETGDQRDEATYLLALVPLYRQIGRLREAISASAQAIEILQALNVSIEEMPYPNWFKSLLKLSEKVDAVFEQIVRKFSRLVKR